MERNPTRKGDSGASLPPIVRWGHRARLGARGGPVPVIGGANRGGSGAWRQPRTTRPGTVASREPLPRTPPERAADRGGRRHGRAPLGCGRGPSLPRGGEPARAGERGRRPHGLHRRGRRADRDEHLRGEQPQARRVLLDDAFEEINSPACASRARPARSRPRRLVAGAIGPLGELEVFDAAEHGPPTPPRRRCSRAAGRPLHDRDVFDLDELVVAVEAVRGVSPCRSSHC